MSLVQVDIRVKYNLKDRLNFALESWSVPEMYWSFLRTYETGKIRVCHIMIADDWGDDLNKFDNIVGFKAVNINFDLERYFKTQKQDRKRMQLEVVHQGMMKIAEKEGWTFDPLLDAYNSCLKNNLEYKFFVRKKLKSSPDRKHKIGFWCEWDIDKFEVYWVLYDKKENEIKRKLLIKKKSHEGEFIYYVSCKWLNNEKVLLEDNYKYSNNEKWEIEING